MTSWSSMVGWGPVVIQGLSRKPSVIVPRIRPVRSSVTSEVTSLRAVDTGSSQV